MWRKAQRKAFLTRGKRLLEMWRQVCCGRLGGLPHRRLPHAHVAFDMRSQASKWTETCPIRGQYFESQLARKFCFCELALHPPSRTPFHTHSSFYNGCYPCLHECRCVPGDPHRGHKGDPRVCRQACEEHSWHEVRPAPVLLSPLEPRFDYITRILFSGAQRCEKNCVL